MTAPQAEAPRLIQHIVVRGTQRVEPGTVLTYVGVREGDNYTPAEVDQALKSLTATGLFSDVKTSFESETGTLTIRVTENPIVNQVVFEGNSKVSDKDLTKEVQIKPRAVFTRAKVQADVQRIIELYRRNGKFAARVDPQIIQRPQNRVDLIFSITDGPTTGVSRINFTGNKIFNSGTLAGQIATEESRWCKFFATNDNYDPDRLQFDRESLRRYYVNRGYADFKVVSAVAQLTPNRESFYINFTISEGVRYRFGKITVDLKIKELPGRCAPRAADRYQRWRDLFAGSGAEGDRRADQRRGHPGLCLRGSASAHQAQRRRPAPSILRSRSSRGRASISKRSTSPATAAPWTR